MTRFLLSALILFWLAALPARAEDALPPETAQTEAEPRMSTWRLHDISRALDPEAKSFGLNIELTISDVPILVITDPIADRMRAMVAIRSVESLSEKELMRMMQANFDTALDARYAIAHGKLWAIFIHPLSPLEKEQYISALAQTVNLAQTYGSLFTGCTQEFGQGDSLELHDNLFRELL